MKSRASWLILARNWAEILMRIAQVLPCAHLSSKAERDEALTIMARVLQRPLFPEAVLAREKARLIAALKEAETKPDSIADKAFSKAVFGATSLWHAVIRRNCQCGKIAARRSGQFLLHSLWCAIRSCGDNG